MVGVFCGFSVFRVPLSWLGLSGSSCGLRGLRCMVGLSLERIGKVKGVGGLGGGVF